MKFKHRIEDKICIIGLEGGFSQDEAKAIKLSFANLLRMNFEGSIINLSETVYLDSIMIGTIMTFFRKCREKHVQLVLCDINLEVRWLFWNRYEDILSIFDTEKEAIAHLKKNA